MKLENIHGLPFVKTNQNEVEIVQNDVYNELLTKHKGFNYLIWRKNNQLPLYIDTEKINASETKKYTLSIGKVRKKLLKTVFQQNRSVYKIIKETPVISIAGDRGYFAKTQNKFYILIGEKMSKDDKVLTYLHELGHLIAYKVYNEDHDSYEKNEFLAFHYSYFLSKRVKLSKLMEKELINLYNKSHLLSKFESKLFLTPEKYESKKEKNILFSLLSSRYDDNAYYESWTYETDLVNYPFLWSGIYNACLELMKEFQKKE